MRILLSIKTVVPRRGGKVWYDDPRDAHRHIYQGEETVDYAFMGADPRSADNRWPRETCENQVSVIYFLGVSLGGHVEVGRSIIALFDGSLEHEAWMPAMSGNKRRANSGLSIHPHLLLEA